MEHFTCAPLLRCCPAALYLRALRCSCFLHLPAAAPLRSQRLQRRQRRRRRFVRALARKRSASRGARQLYTTTTTARRRSGKSGMALLFLYAGGVAHSSGC